MASIRKPRMTAKGRVWDVDYRDPVTGKGRMKTFPTLTLAKVYKAQIETELARGEYLDRSKGQQTFAVFAADWLSLHQVRPATLQKLTSLLGNHIVPYFGPVPLVRISERDIRAFVVHLDGKGLAPATIKSVVQSLKAVLHAALEAGAIAKTPVPARLRLPENHAAEAVFMSGEEVDRLTVAMPENYQALVTLLARTGLRWSELAGLTRKRIDFLRKRLTVAETYTDGRFAPVKTPASRRTIELSTGTVEALAEHLRVHRPDIAPDDFIFTTPQGMGLDDNRFRARVWRPAVECAGLSGRHPTPHDLRHTHAAWLIEDGRHVKEIQARLGHSSITTTMNVYGHLLPGVGEGRLDSLDSRCRTDAVWQREAPSS